MFHRQPARSDVGQTVIGEMLISLRRPEEAEERFAEHILSC